MIFFTATGTVLSLLGSLELSAILEHIPFVPGWNRPYLHAGTGPFYAKFWIVLNCHVETLSFCQGRISRAYISPTGLESFFSTQALTINYNQQGATTLFVKVGTDLEGEEDCLFFIWPTTVVHKGLRNIHLSVISIIHDFKVLKGQKRGASTLVSFERSGIPGQWPMFLRSI
jgi:hypothetical protein